MNCNQHKNIIILLLMLFTLVSCAQQGKIKKEKKVTDGFSSMKIELLIASSLYIVKENCECQTLKGYRYRIVYDSITDHEKTYCDYSYGPVIGAADSLKIPIIKALLELSEDSSLCCKAVKRYGSNQNQGKIVPKSATYNLQIDALYTLNMIAFGSYIRTYCPYPVLYDTTTMEEINNDPSKIKEVFEIYRKWFSEAQDLDFKNYEFPLINTRYRWYGGRTYNLILKSLPNGPNVGRLGQSYLEL